jgi:hypothetical protein
MPSPLPAPSPSINPPIPFLCSVPASVILVVSSKRRALIIGYGLGDHLDHTGSSTSCWVDPSIGRSVRAERSLIRAVFLAKSFRRSVPGQLPFSCLSLSNNSNTHLPCCAFLSSHCLVLRISSKHRIITSSRREKPLLLGAVC